MHPRLVFGQKLPYINAMLEILIIIGMGISLALTLASLVAGVFIMSRVQDKARRQSNVLMRYRVIFQLATVGFFIAWMALQKSG